MLKIQDSNFTCALGLLTQHAEAATKDQQDAGQNNKQTTAATTAPGSVRALRVKIATPAERSHAHGKSPLLQAQFSSPIATCAFLCNKRTNARRFERGLWYVSIDKPT